MGDCYVNHSNKLNCNITLNVSDFEIRRRIQSRGRDVAVLLVGKTNHVRGVPHTKAITSKRVDFTSDLPITAEYN
jgi:hypothetical protein